MPVKDPNSITEEELTEKYNHGRTWVASLSTSVLLEKYELIGPASMGGFSTRKQTGADMGGYGSICYVFDEMTETYHGVTLRQGGDWSYENTSSEARTLADWLESLHTSVK
jgi:hypothetical protein